MIRSLRSLMAAYLRPDRLAAVAAGGPGAGADPARLRPQGPAGRPAHRRAARPGRSRDSRLVRAAGQRARVADGAPRRGRRRGTPAARLRCLTGCAVEPLEQADGDRVARLLADRRADAGLHRQAGRVFQPHPGSRADASRPASLSFAPRRTPLRGAPPPSRIGRPTRSLIESEFRRHALVAAVAERHGGALERLAVDRAARP